MRRDTREGKTRYVLVPLPLTERVAEHYTKGAKKYDAYNWTKANSWEEWLRFVESAERHFKDWYKGKQDEDHLSACVFNMYAAEYVREKLMTGKTPSIMPFGHDMENEEWNMSDEEKRQLNSFREATEQLKDKHIKETIDEL